MKSPFILFPMSLLLMALLHTDKLSAQNLIGAKAGLNYTMLDDYIGPDEDDGHYYESMNDSKNKFGFELGIFLIRIRSERFSYQHQLYLNKRAFFADYTSHQRYSSVSRQLDLSVVNLNYSMLAQYHFLKKPNLFIKVGPYFGGKMITRAEGTIKVWNEEPEEINGNGHHYFGDVDLGFNSGIGALLDLPNGQRLLLELTDGFSLASIIDYRQMNTLTFTVGYVFISMRNRFQSPD